MAKLQSAMEYLMTYGWAILIIAVVLGALYQLGIFSGSGIGSSNSCLTTAGFTCQTPVLNSTGWLGIKFGQIGTGSITITATGCTANTISPAVTQNTYIILSSGQTSAIPFSCPLSSNAIGTTFSGYLWLVYNTQSATGLIDKIAVVNTKVTTTRNVTAILGGVAPSKFSATGGTVTFSAGHEIHTFTTNGVFTLTGGAGSVNVLVVGGGGGGGSQGGGAYGGGGGGGGGFQSVNDLSLTPAAYTVTIGSGGAGSAPAQFHAGYAGTSSIFYTVTAAGGNGGNFGSGCCGGDGTGGSAGGGSPSGGAGDSYSGGGGGGAGAAGTSAVSTTPGNGGDGLSSSISGSPVTYAGGGAGGGYSAPGSAGSGSVGGGGNGGSNGGVGSTGATGAAGIVIVSFNAAGNGTP
ncbi:MAG: hypothetical protein KGH59_02070 [Candidatus Micrarchaeota archaeon]|nr:hypothetical protein [Candidatus Micrarchaeota archaeon]